MIDETTCGRLVPPKEMEIAHGAVALALGGSGLESIENVNVPGSSPAGMLQ